MNRTLALALAMIGAFSWAWWTAQTPAPLKEYAAPTVFSAGRGISVV